ncbi:allantoicase [Sciscionella marina]|uniref:allantoicase n=1 Tax=Sciscionella marina TaxID=508770 RepID=UPI0003634DDF
MTEPEFRTLPDLACRDLGGAVLVANDEFFAERENLINPGAASFDAQSFGHKGKVYDGWETRRRRGPGHDWAIVRLGAPGVIHGVIVDTAFFTGNYPESCSVEAAAIDGHPSPEELSGPDVEWVPIVANSALKGDTENSFEVSSPQRFTHVRLNIVPDGGVARLRVHGAAVADPRWIAGAPLDLAALENGGIVADCSNRFYSAPNNLLRPDLARSMGDGWETARRRDDGNDFVTVRLAGEGVLHQIEIDTRYFKGNAPGWFRLSGGAADTDSARWTELLPRTALQPDTRHRFRIRAGEPVGALRVDVYPDGGFARFRAYGELTAAGREHLGIDWFDRLPDSAAAAVLAAEADLSATQAAALLAHRPLRDAAGLDAALTAAKLAEAPAAALRDLLRGS